jgi:hypothetical protein
MAESKKTYTQDEINEILKRALSQQSLREQTLSHEDLVQVAAEVGIDRNALDAASAEIAKTQEAELAKRSEAAELATERRIQLRRLLASAIRLGVLNGALYFIDMHVSGGTWFQWPLLASGVLLALQVRHVVSPEQRLARRRAREERERRRAARRAQVEAVKQKLISATSDAPAAAREFESAVQAGVTALVKVATKKLEEHLERRDSHRR